MKLKWTIHELIKNAKTNKELDFSLELGQYITQEQEDLVDISVATVTGFYEYFKDENLFVFDFIITTSLTMLCALTLEEVMVDIDFETQLNFSTKYIDDDTHVIEGITIEIDQYIFSEILIEKPMKVYTPNALEEYKEDVFKASEEELVSSSPFAKIKQ